MMCFNACSQSVRPYDCSVIYNLTTPSNGKLISNISGLAIYRSTVTAEGMHNKCVCGQNYAHMALQCVY